MLTKQVLEVNPDTKKLVMQFVVVRLWARFLRKWELTDAIRELLVRSGVTLEDKLLTETRVYFKESE